MAVYWGMSLAAGDSLDVAATYRHGDHNYFPLMAGLANFSFGEWPVIEHLGGGIRSFPAASLAIHSLAIGLLGVWGFVLADLIAVVGCYFAASRLFRSAELSAGTSEVLALVVSCGVLAWPGGHLQEWLDWAPRLHLWGFRLPRPFVTDIFLLLCLGSALRIFCQSKHGLSEWLWLGAFFGLLAQSRFYSAATMGLAIGVGVAVLVLRESSRRKALAGASGSCVLAVLVALPFAAQLLISHPDVRVRLGAFPVERLQPLFLAGQGMDVLAPLLVAVAVSALVFWSKPERAWNRISVLLALGLVCMLAGIALPASTLLLGETIQPYQFGEELVAFKTVTLIVAIAQTVDVAVARLSKTAPRSVPAWGQPALVLVTAALCLLSAISLHGTAVARETHMRPDFRSYRVPQYRRAFRELSAELASPRYADARVLASFDIQVLDWWTLFGGGHTFTPNTCSTGVSDDEIEDRLFRFFRILGVTEEDASALVLNRSVLIFMLSCAKHQASSGHQFSPLSDYPKRLQPRIMSSSPLASWNIILPMSERSRLSARYAQTRSDSDDPRLDLIVLGGNAFGAKWAPAPERFQLSFQNRLFRVYLAEARIAE
jgi:hypothetical protein